MGCFGKEMVFSSFFEVHWNTLQRLLIDGVCFFEKNFKIAKFTSFASFSLYKGLEISIKEDELKSVKANKDKAFSNSANKTLLPRAVGAKTSCP